MQTGTGVSDSESVNRFTTGNTVLPLWVKFQPGNVQNGRAVPTVTNPMADFEAGTLISYSNFIVTIAISRLAFEIFVCDAQTDRQTGKWTDRQHGPLLQLAPPMWWLANNTHNKCL